MAIKQLTEQQVREWTLEQKDEWWLKNVYKGDMKQLTWRSGITGALLGGILSLTNLYVGIRTGWTLGVGITSVVISFAVFKIFSKFGLADEMTILENNAMQSISAAAGYMTMPLMAAISGYMMVTNTIPPQWQVYLWIVALALLGVLFAFPLKKRAINDEQLLFPEGYACGVVMDSLHTTEGGEGMKRAKYLMGGAAASAIIEFLRNEPILKRLHMGFMTLPQHWDDFLYSKEFGERFFTPSILGTPMNRLLLQFDSSIVMMGAGTIMSMRTAVSMLIGGLLNYAILAPIMIQQGVIPAEGGFRNISLWGLWGGASMMTTASLYSFFAAPSTVAAFKNVFNKSAKKKQKSDVLKHIELPFSVSAIGVPVLTLALMIMGKEFFNVSYWLTFVSVPLVFFFSIMAVKATGLTGTTPGSALAKMTQVVYAFLAPGDMGVSVTSAGVTASVSLNASNLLMDIKPGYMLGAKPRQQAIGHAIGIFVGGLVAVPVFYKLFHGDISLFGTDAFPMPSALVWKAVAEILSKGITSLHVTARWAVVIGGLLGIILEMIVIRTKNKFPISPVGLGLPFVLSFTDTFMMFLGCFIFWLLKRKPVEKRGAFYNDFAENQESIGAGIIAGGSIIGIVLLLIETSL